MLASTDESTPEIEVLSDGSWAALREQLEYESEEEPQAAGQPKTEAPVVDLDDGVMIIDCE